MSFFSFWLINMWFPWQQGKVYLSNFGFKTSPIYFKEKSQSFRKSSLLFWSYAPQASPTVGLKRGQSSGHCSHCWKFSTSGHAQYRIWALWKEIRIGRNHGFLISEKLWSFYLFVKFCKTFAKTTMFSQVSAACEPQFSFSWIPEHDPQTPYQESISVTD